MSDSGGGRRDFVKTVGLGLGAVTSLGRAADAAPPAERESEDAARVLADPEWPSLKRYDGEHLARIALPLGGIGTGTVSLGGRGDLRDWEIMNRPAKGFVAGAARRRAVLRALSRSRPAGRRSCAPARRARSTRRRTRAATARPAPNHGLPRFRDALLRRRLPASASVHPARPRVPLEVHAARRSTRSCPPTPSASGIAGGVAALRAAQPLAPAVDGGRLRHAAQLHRHGRLADDEGLEGRPTARRGPQGQPQRRPRTAGTRSGVFLYSDGRGPAAPSRGARSRWRHCTDAEVTYAHGLGRAGVGRRRCSTSGTTSRDDGRAGGARGRPKTRHARGLAGRRG